jgi:hypothetical protein
MGWDGCSMHPAIQAWRRGARDDCRHPRLSSPGWCCAAALLGGSALLCLRLPCPAPPPICAATGRWAALRSLAASGTLPRAIGPAPRRASLAPSLSAASTPAVRCACAKCARCHGRLCGLPSPACWARLCPITPSPLALDDTTLFFPPCGASPAIFLPKNRCSPAAAAPSSRT